MSNVIPIRGNLDVAGVLRHIADQIDAGEYPGETMTLILDAMIFSAGDIPEAEAVPRTVFDLNWALHQLMVAASADD